MADILKRIAAARRSELYHGEMSDLLSDAASEIFRLRDAAERLLGTLPECYARDDMTPHEFAREELRDILNEAKDA